ncbi:MAG: hypothetical protein BWY09_03029 [Candidatus Hydrogenedentes bacterium ADurb.Bin179]|nr:MAG: hypothetical protein BWY09_03029 [Candidatus Hydrogenedentes bacterium ADurb.Bin179]
MQDKNLKPNPPNAPTNAPTPEEKAAYRAHLDRMRELAKTSPDPRMRLLAKAIIQTHKAR